MDQIIVAGIVGVVLIAWAVATRRRIRHLVAGNQRPQGWSVPNLLEPSAHQFCGPSEPQSVGPLASPARQEASVHLRRSDHHPFALAKSHFDFRKHAIMATGEHWPILAARAAPVVCQSALERVETVCLVSCVGTKQTNPAQAKDLYQSDWFIKARAYAEAVGSCWFILSAKYGLVHPDDVIEPYEMTLNTIGVTERRDWACHVQGKMDKQMPDAGRIVVLAGKRYRDFLMDYLQTRAERVEVPMANLGIGKQKNWLRSQLGHGQTR